MCFRKDLTDTYQGPEESEQYLSEQVNEGGTEGGRAGESE